MKIKNRKTKMRKSLKTKKNYLGGNKLSNPDLAYTKSNIFSIKNPHLSYTGKGGSCGMSNAYPSNGPQPTNQNWLNSSSQRGGCGCSGSIQTLLQNGGSHREGCKCSLCKHNVEMGGSHKKGCNCSLCMHNKNAQHGGKMPLLGQPWTPNVMSWSGVNGTNNSGKYLEYNDYNNGDIQLDIKSTGMSPYNYLNLKGGKHNKRTILKKVKNNKTQKQRAGGISNFLYNDVINLGRQFNNGLGTAYNALNGYSSPVNPLPWKQQLVNTPDFKTIKMI